MAKLQRFRAGDPLDFSAGALNDAMAAADKAKRRDKVLGVRELPESDESGSIILVENTSDVHVDRFGILGLGEPIVDPSAHLDAFLNLIAFTAVKPVMVDHFGKFVVTLEPIGKDSVGRAFLSGVCPCKLSVGDSSHLFADVLEGNVEKLQTGTIGRAQILWKESGTGDKWGLVHLGTAVAGGSTRSGRITAVIEVDGPPSAHTYDGDFIDVAGGTWGNLSCLRRPSNVIQLAMEVGDYVAVVSEWDVAESAWVNRGIFGHEGVEFIICECDWS